MSLLLAACGTVSTDNTPLKSPARIEGQPFIYTDPLGKSTDLSAITFKTNGMVRIEESSVLGVGGTLYTHTRYGAWASRTGQTDLFALGNTPSGIINLIEDQVYYGRALRAAQESVYDNRLTYTLNFNSHVLTGFSVSPPDVNTFGKSILMRGTINGDKISGTVESGTAKGVFSGQFYGANGAEFVGTAHFQNRNLDFSFGGDLQ